MSTVVENNKVDNRPKLSILYNMKNIAGISPISTMYKCNNDLFSSSKINGNILKIANIVNINKKNIKQFLHVIGRFSVLNSQLIELVSY